MVQRSPSYVMSLPRLEPLLAGQPGPGAAAVLARVARVRSILIHTALYGLSRRSPRLLRAVPLR